MKAVNLLPREARGSFGTLRGLGAGTTVLLGALAAGFVLVAVYVVMANGVTDKRTELQSVQANVAATERQVAALKPYADLEELRKSLLERVRTLADSRYDWPETLSRVARAFPQDAVLTTLDGGAGDDGAAPTIALAGCVPTHNRVAALIDRLRAVKGVQGVALQSSTLAKGAAAAGDAGSSCPHADQFKMTVQLEGATAPAGAAQGATGAAAATPAQGTSTTPAPAATPVATPAPTGGTP